MSLFALLFVKRENNNLNFCLMITLLSSFSAMVGSV